MKNRNCYLKNRVFKLVLCSLVYFFFGSGAVYGAEITKINQKKRAAMINGGSDDGFDKGAKICFFEGKKKVACGVVVKTKSNKAIVKIKAGNFEGLRKGMKASTGKGGRKGGGSFSVKGFYLYTAMTPVVFNQINYVPTPGSGTTPDAVWEPGKKISSSQVGGGAEFDIPIGGSFAISPGFHYRKLSYPQPVENDYEVDKMQPFVKSSGTPSSMGGYLNAYYVATSSSSFRLDLGMGIDYEMSSLSFRANLVDDDAGTETEMVNVTSKANAISARLVGNGTLLLASSFGLIFGVNALVPLTVSSSFSATIEDRHIATDDESLAIAQSDLKNALGHKKNSFGLEIMAGLRLLF